MNFNKHTHTHTHTHEQEKEKKPLGTLKTQIAVKKKKRRTQWTQKCYRKLFLAHSTRPPFVTIAIIDSGDVFTEFWSVSSLPRCLPVAVFFFRVFKKYYFRFRNPNQAKPMDAMTQKHRANALSIWFEKKTNKIRMTSTPTGLSIRPDGRILVFFYFRCCCRCCCFCCCCCGSIKTQKRPLKLGLKKKGSSSR